MKDFFRGDDPLFSIRKAAKIDYALLLMMIGASAIGVVAIGAADIRHPGLSPDGFAVRHLAGTVIGALIAFILPLFDLRGVFTHKRFCQAVYALSLLLLVAVRLFGVTYGGAKRWIDIGPFSFQPSEVVKILLILFYAEFIIRYKNRMHSLGIFTISAACGAVVLALIALQPDLSTAAVTALIVCGMFFAAGLAWQIVGGVIAAMIPLVLILFMDALSGSSRFLRGYQAQRILAWLHPEDYADSFAYQTMNSMIAIGSGGAIGKGLDAAQSQTLFGTGYIAESTTDFIYTVIGETLGFAGCVLVIALLFGIALRCFMIATYMQDPRGSLIAMGTGIWVLVQSFLNIGVATGLLPNTGIPLPFISSGLSSLLCLYTAAGIVMNVRIHDHEDNTAGPYSTERSEE